jgi:hypothetical protein
MATLFVSWPFSIVPPRRHFQLVPMFDSANGHRRQIGVTFRDG